MSSTEKLYAKIYQHYKEQIISGQLEEGDQLPTETQLMAAYSVSRITAKRALDDLEREGYIYRQQGSGSFVKSLDEHFHVTQSNIRQVAFVVPTNSKGGPFLTMMKGAMDFFNPLDYQVTFYDSYMWNETSEAKSLIRAREDGCDGVIYYPSSVETDQGVLFRMSANRFPIVLVDKSLDSLPITSVISDNAAGSYALTKHLLEKGHKKIAFIAEGDGLGNASGGRYLGCCQAAIDAGFGTDIIVRKSVFYDREDFIINYERYNEIVTERMVEMVQRLREEGITAACTLNDNIAMRLLQAMHIFGLSAPEDIAVGGYDDSEYAELAAPELTTVRQDFYAQGLEAAKMLYRIIQNPETPPTHKVIPVQLIVRKST